jgi:hypothetical protein
VGRISRRKPPGADYRLHPGLDCLGYLVFGGAKTSSPWDMSDSGIDMKYLGLSLVQRLNVQANFDMIHWG